MAKRIHPSSWNQDPIRARAPARRGRGSRARTNSGAAMTDSAVLEDSLLDILRRRLPDQDTSGFTLADLLFAAGSPVDALLYSRLFWPELTGGDIGICFHQSGA